MHESSNLEYKSKLSRTYLKTVSAFANYGTGEIVFGVDDDGTAVGLENPRSDALKIENAINDAIKPTPSFTIDIDETARTVTLTVEEGPAKPYLYGGKAYRRADTSTVEVGKTGYARLVLEGMNTTFDALESRSQELSFECLSLELSSKLALQCLDENALKSLELMSPSGKFNNAAALLADRNDCPGTDIARFGDQLNVILSRHSLEGISVIEQMRDTMSIFDEHYAYEEIVGARRVAKSLIPREAFREALANALVHRAWDVAASTKVSMFPDRIEVSSPGGLPEGITRDEYLAGGLALARNPILANVFFRLGYIERFGTGIPRIIQEYAELDVSPVFKIHEASITVVLPVEDKIELNDSEKAVLAALPKGQMLSRAQIAEAADVSKDKAIRMLNRLIDKKLVAQTGSGRATRYTRA